MFDLGKSADFPEPPPGLSAFAVTCKKVRLQQSAMVVIQAFIVDHEQVWCIAATHSSTPVV
jgi:hypothetical protein